MFQFDAYSQKKRNSQNVIHIMNIDKGLRALASGARQDAVSSGSVGWPCITTLINKRYLTTRHSLIVLDQKVTGPSPFSAERGDEGTLNMQGQGTRKMNISGV